MTVAVCLGCGELKQGVSAPCPKCSYTAKDIRSQARQMLATDTYHNREELEAIAARVKAGQPIEFAAETIHVGWMREEVKRLTTQFGTVPPPWIVMDEHPYSIGWRMGGGELHIRLWWEWWPQQGFTEDQRIDYFRKWPPPHRWLVFLIEAVWGIDSFRQKEQLPPYFEHTSALGFGSQQDYERDLNDPIWSER